MSPTHRLSHTPLRLWYAVLHCGGRPLTVVVCRSHTGPVSVCWGGKSQIGPGPRFSIKMPSYHFRKSPCGDKTVLRSSYLPKVLWITPSTFSRTKYFVTSRPERNGRNFANYIFKNNFILKEHVCIVTKYHWTFFPTAQLTLRQHWSR